MYRFILTGICCFFSSVAIAAGRNDLYKANLRGRVKTDTIYQYALRDYMTAPKWVLDYIYIDTYNPQGNIVAHKTISYSADTITESVDSFFYNKAGHKTVSIAYGKNTSFIHYKYKYDATGNEIESIYYGYGNKPFSKTVYTYNARNIMIEEKEMIISEQYYNAKNFYKYDSIGNRISEKLYDVANHFVCAYRISYNDMGFPVKKAQQHEKGGRFLPEWEYEYFSYDRYGNWLEMENHPPPMDPKMPPILHFKTQQRFEYY